MVDHEGAKKRKRLEEEANIDGDGVMGEDIMAWLSSPEECDDVSVNELMKLLETDSPNNGNGNMTTRVKFIENPYLYSMIFQSSSSYVTINGNEESCGSSFSDSESSVMASFHMTGVVNDFFGVGGAWEGAREEDDGIGMFWLDGAWDWVLDDEACSGP